jgi:polar amino acid transport system substrate-binding protein
MSASREVASRLAPSRVLSAGISLSNVLLVTGRAPEGDPDCVSPDTARTIAAGLGVPVEVVPHARSSEPPDAEAEASGRVAGFVAGHTAPGPSAPPAF